MLCNLEAIMRLAVKHASDRVPSKNKRKHSLSRRRTYHIYNGLVLSQTAVAKPPLHQAYHHIVTKINTATEKPDDTRHIKTVIMTILASLHTSVNDHRYILKTLAHHTDYYIYN